VDRLRSN